MFRASLLMLTNDSRTEKTMFQIFNSAWILYLCLLLIHDCLHKYSKEASYTTVNMKEKVGYEQKPGSIHRPVGRSVPIRLLRDFIDFTKRQLRGGSGASWVQLLGSFGDLKMKLTSNTSLAAKAALAHRLQRRNACKIQNGRQGAPKWLTGSGKVSIPKFLGILSNFR